MNETKALADFLSILTYHDLPRRAVTGVKKVLLDWLGLAIAGSTELPPSILREVILANDNGAEATVLADNGRGGIGIRKSALNAAFLNGAASHAQDFDDLHNASIIHLACVVVPAAFALGESKCISGKELITAIAAGYELGGRVGESIQPESYYFWHTTGTVGHLSAASAASSVLHLDGPHFLHALGSAGTQAAGLWDFVKQGAMSKPLHAGKACYGGVLSALIAQKEYTGSTTILEGEKGFCRSMSPHPKWKFLTDNLGSDFIICHNSIKPYPCCKHSHAAVYGIKQLMNEKQIHAEEIRDITILVNDITNSLINNAEPLTPYGCKFSIQYCAASMAVRGKVAISDFREPAIYDEAVRSMMKKIRVINDGEMTKIYEAHPDQLASKVIITLTNGESCSLFVPHPKGDPENAMTMEDIAAKGHGLVDSMIGEKSYEMLKDIVLHLEDV
ncbi:MmgE/PrpD family protein, partial [Dialister sp.]|uniref:MmgE/PrpD family protein n=1 Tax=Dialister sp. TaxID=1955814 RepID=UPI003F0527ED